MVDFDLEIEKVHPINVREIELSKQKIDDNIKKSIVLYNSAIGDVKKCEFELAIGDLKKAIYYNKDFIEAIKLLGLCYAKMDQYKNAEKTFKSLNKYEIYNILVNEYLESLSTKQSMYKFSKALEEAESIPSNSNGEFSSRKKSKKKLVLGLIILMLFIAGAGLNFFYPGITQEALATVRTSIHGVQEKFQMNNKIAEATKEESVENLNKEEVVVKENNKNIEVPEDTNKTTDNVKIEADNYKNETVNMLNDIEKSLNNGNYEKAANNLINMKDRNFDEGTKSIFNQLWQSLKPNPIWGIYNDGNKLYKQNKYSEALPKLIIASEFVPDVNLMPWITYQIGICYRQTNDKTNALIYFNKVKDNYPKSQYVSYAKTAISEISP